MTARPTGTVTFLFTDVEGSTRQASADAAAWSAALARHKGIVRAAVSDEDGFVFQVIGDACFAAFPTAGRAVAAALSAQRMLQAEQWPAARVLRGARWIPESLGKSFVVEKQRGQTPMFRRTSSPLEGVR